MDTELLQAITKLIELILNRFGTIGTLLICVFLIILSFGWRYYNDLRKDKEVNEIIAEKDRTILRLSDECRTYKIIVFKDKLNWTDNEIDKFLLNNNSIINNTNNQNDNEED